MALVPQRSGNRQWIDFLLNPPSPLLAVVVKLTVVEIAERHGELIAYLTAQRARLRECQVMGMSWPTAANHTSLGSDKIHMVLIAQALRFGQMQFAFVNQPTTF
jgi:hypothetical protein